MDKPKTHISIVAALGVHDRAVGSGNHLLWHISDDLKRFKELTLGNPVIMGRKTFESITGYLDGPLPDRPNIVVSRNTSYTHPGVTVVHSLDEALSHARSLKPKEIFIGGGGTLWREALPLVDKLYLTLVDDTKHADVFFPEYEKEFTKETFREERLSPDGLRYTWVDLERG